METLKSIIASVLAWMILIGIAFAIHFLSGNSKTKRLEAEQRMRSVEYCFVRVSKGSPMREKVLFVSFENMINRSFFKYRGIDSDGKEVLVTADIDECKEGVPAVGGNPRQ